jgi:hypothetical protein
VGIWIRTQWSKLRLTITRRTEFFISIFHFRTAFRNNKTTSSLMLFFSRRDSTGVPGTCKLNVPVAHRLPNKVLQKPYPWQHELPLQIMSSSFRTIVDTLVNESIVL